MSARPLKLDLHTHILPQTWPDLRERYGYGGFVRIVHHTQGAARMMIDEELFREVTEQTWDPARRLADCDRHGVDVQVLSTVPVMFSYWAKPEDAFDLARILNDHIAEVVSRHPSRFLGLGTVPLQAPELAVVELERCLLELGMAGVQIGTHVNDWNLDAPELFPFFERAQDLGAAVFVHPWDMVGSERMPRYWLPWLVGMPTETALAITSLMFGGVLERLPRLKLGFAHGGGAFPGLIGRIDKGYHARPDLCAVRSSRAPRAHLGRFLVDSLVFDADALRSLLRLLGPSAIALGSDYPFPLGEEEPGRLIESMPDLDAATRRRLLADNALDFLGRSRESLGR